MKWNRSENLTIQDLKREVKYQPHPQFGSVFIPSAFVVDLVKGEEAPKQGEIHPISGLNLSPATASLHYAQSIFEGLKAYRQGDGSVAIFRLDKHAERFRKSAQRMSMVDVPEGFFIEAVKDYVHFVEKYVPNEEGHSLYLRPLLFNADPLIKVGSGTRYKLVIMSAIVGDYFGGQSTIKAPQVMVSRQFVRAFPGGSGEAKTAANYALSLAPQAYAASKGCDQVLYLDAVEHEYIDELGGMNFFVLRGNELITPELNGCILRGVTRDSLLKLAEQMDLQPKEEKISITQLIREIKAGEVEEVFACGTAAVVTPISALVFENNAGEPLETVALSGKHDRTLQLRKALMDIHCGRAKAPGEWMFNID